MTQEKIKRIHMIYGIVMSVLLAAAGICLVAACIAIYHSGETPLFTRERVSEYFASIAIPVFVCIAAVIGGGILQWVLPEEKKTEKGSVEPYATLSRLYRRLDRKGVSDEIAEKLAVETRGRIICKTVCAILCVACAVPVILYLFTPANFGTKNINRDVFSAMLFSVCFFLDGVIFCVVTHILTRLSLEREIALVKRAMKEGAILEEPIDYDEDWNAWGRTLTRVLGTALAILVTVVFTVTVLRVNRLISADAVGTLALVILFATVLTALCLTLYFVFLWKRPDLPIKKWGLWTLRIAIALVALVFILIGILNGGASDVLSKAIRICTECIGLG